MPLIDPVSLSTAYILAGLAACPSQGNVSVDVNLDVKSSPYITNIASQTLTQQFANDPDSTLATDGKWMISGLTKTNIASSYDVQFQTHKNTKTGETCLAVSKVVYTIIYNPVIYIASDYLGMGCRYSATLMHEKKHVQNDRLVLNGALTGIRREIENYAETIGPQGPYPEVQVKTEQQRIIQMIDAALKPQFEKLVALRRQKQGAMDTEDSYRRDTAVCPGQFPKFEK